MNLSQLQPNRLWYFFERLNAIPRPSKKEQAVRDWVVDLGQKWGFYTATDEVGNVLIRKPSTPGLESSQTVVLQSHLDMVCQKNNDTSFDFETQGIDMYVDGDWVRANGTTLGADNGIGVAAILALLDSTDIPHPPLEALFTIDEETGMTGALGLKGGFLTGSVLFNLDTEDDDELSIGCAGGVDVTSSGTYELESVVQGMLGIELTISAGSGGHSGMDIHKGIANVNKLMNRMLLEINEAVDIRICSVEGGGLRNAIPRESASKFIVAPEDVQKAERLADDVFDALKAEYSTTDPGLKMKVSRMEIAPESAMSEESQMALLWSIQACPVGIHRMSPDIPNLVQTSNNLARVQIANGSIVLQCLCRSSVDSEKDDHARSIAACFALAGLDTELSGDYPGWTPNPKSAVVEMLRGLYHEKYHEAPRVLACHAGLECGILGTNYPSMDMVSFGPNIRGAHSPDECVQISSVQKFWDFLQDALKRIPKAA